MHFVVRSVNTANSFASCFWCCVAVLLPTSSAEWNGVCLRPGLPVVPCTVSFYIHIQITFNSYLHCLICLAFLIGNCCCTKVSQTETNIWLLSWNEMIKCKGEKCYCIVLEGALVKNWLPCFPRIFWILSIKSYQIQNLWFLEDKYVCL